MAHGRLGRPVADAPATPPASAVAYSPSAAGPQGAHFGTAPKASRAAAAQLASARMLFRPAARLVDFGFDSAARQSIQQEGHFASTRRRNQCRKLPTIRNSRILLKPDWLSRLAPPAPDKDISAAGLLGHDYCWLLAGRAKLIIYLACRAATYSTTRNDASGINLKPRRRIGVVLSAISAPSHEPPRKDYRRASGAASRSALAVDEISVPPASVGFSKITPPERFDICRPVKPS